MKRNAQRPLSETRRISRITANLMRGNPSSPHSLRKNLFGDSKGQSPLFRITLKFLSSAIIRIICILGGYKVTKLILGREAINAESEDWANHTKAP